jgi:hypothetical protein
MVRREEEDLDLDKTNLICDVAAKWLGKEFFEVKLLEGN